MSEMSSKLEQVLEYLVNGEQDKAESLLHDVIVEKARSIHEEIVNAQDTVEETAETKEESTEEAVEETKEESTEEAVEETKEESEDEAVEETVGGETGDAETDMKAELKQKAEEDSEEIDYEETNEDEHEGEDESEGEDEEVEDRVDDLEKALEELKAKFDDIVNGEEGDDMEGTLTKENEDGTPVALKKGGSVDTIPASLEGKQSYLLAENEYIIPEPVVRAVGGGNVDAGADAFDRFIENVKAVA